jgi:hypothetical protein
MRARPVPPLGSSRDRPVPSHRTRFPTFDPLPQVNHDRQEIRENLYRRVKKEPITAAEASRITGLSLVEARDELRTMEEWLLTRHTADDLGVIRWRWNPANYWEIGETPF